MDYTEFVQKLTSNVLERADTNNPEELAQTSFTVIEMFQESIRENGETIAQVRENMLPETEILFWMLVAIVLNDVLKAVSQETGVSITEMRSHIPDKYVEFVQAE